MESAVQGLQLLEDKSTFAVRIFEEQLDHVNVFGAGEGIATNADAKRLAQAHISSLCDGFVCQGA